MPSELLNTDMTVLGLAHGHMHPTLMPSAHRHNEVELNFVESGAMTYLFGGARVVVRTGQLAFFWATLPHQVIQVREETRFHWLTIPFSFFLQWRVPAHFLQRVLRCECLVGSGEPTLLQPQFQQWRSDLQAKSEERNQIVLLEVEACMRRLALTIATAGDSSYAEDVQHVEPRVLSKIEQMTCFIAEHYAEPLHTQDIADAAHLHPNYAMSLFRKHVGMSMLDYITRYRLAHAQRLLITTDANVSAIALAAGFGSVSRFYSIFKASCGLHPAEYRGGLRLPVFAEEH
ncbi:helix-turn-helix domain-containing protein [Dictyobacter aurantiacus]|uniref:AraC family transcriptional regulator n=1 Tax=Dictyobacter aurantiacus TaxID=1936993 RepID=A0A401ZGC8_9CHLR|nr:helix-turn-helix domain-containing protein [Dictyobacter aurantiacus]GCE05940.1 AraC family transcriptional regulator [Dictyobacter aurantiacus]